MSSHKELPGIASRIVPTVRRLLEYSDMRVSAFRSVGLGSCKALSL